MTFEIGLVLGILGVAIVLFASEKIRVDVVSMMVLLALLLTGLLDTEQAFSGFSNPAVITVWAIYIVSASLTYTGIADFIGRYIAKIAGFKEWRLILVLMVTVGTMSAFMNNIGATAVLLPVAIDLGRRAKVAVSKLLIPLAFGSLLGGVTTLIGTPPNLLASTALADAGLEPFSLFDYTPMGLIIMVSSTAYMVLIGRHLLPNRGQTHLETEELTTEYELRDYMAELHVQASSPLVGKTIVETHLGEEYDLTVMGVIRDGNVRLGILPNAHVRAGDRLLVKGKHEEILRIGEQIGALLVPEHILGDEDLKSSEVTISEVVVSQLASFIGKTLKESDFRNRYGVTVLAIWRRETGIETGLADVELQMGDTILVQGRRERIEGLRDNNSFLLLRSPEEPSRRLSKAPINLIIFVSMITLVSLGILHISVAAVLGAILSVLTGCLSMDEAYNSIEWKSVYLIAGMLPMGIAMETSGTAAFLSDQIISIVGQFGSTGILVGLFILTTIITAFMSNAAAAVLVAPIAISAAFDVGADPRGFVMSVGIAASNAFLFPIGHQALILVYGPGNYRFFDYTKVGLPLTLLIWILMLIFLPIFWQL